MLHRKKETDMKTDQSTRKPLQMIHPPQITTMHRLHLHHPLLHHPPLHQAGPGPPKHLLPWRWTTA